MKKWSSNRHCPALLMAGLLIIVSGVLSAGYSRADEPKPAARVEPIRITADKLVIDSNANTAVFSGHACAVQGKSKATADQLTIVYGTAGTGQTGLNVKSFKRIEFKGHVRIEMDNRIATCEKAVYLSGERKVILSGPGSKVISGRDQVTGDIITFYRNEGRIEVAGDGRNRVKATFHSTERGLN